VWVGMIALMGLDAETGVFMLLFLDLSYDKAVKEGKMRTEEDLTEAIVHGAVKRVRPKMMTVCAAFMGLLPIMWSTGSGADMMKRVAAPMVGGLLTSFLLELLVYPPPLRSLEAPPSPVDSNQSLQLVFDRFPSKILISVNTSICPLQVLGPRARLPMIVDNQQFLDVAIKNLPGGLILVDLRGRVRAINETAELLLGLTGKVAAGEHCRNCLDAHPKIVKVLQDTCGDLTGANRQELVTQRPDGEKMVVGYSTVIMKNEAGEAIGVAMTFQDITRLIPLMDSEQFLNIALKNMPGGLIFVDVQGRLRGVNEMARRILGIKEDIEPGMECHKALVHHPHVYKVLLATCESLNAVNRQEITTRKSDGEKVTLGYGTLILRDGKGKPIGVGMTFQDITRYIPLPLKAEFIRIVDRFFTPFALSLVLSSLFLGFAEPKAKWISVGLVVFLGIFNEISAYIAKKHIDWAVAVGNTRLITNFIANIALVYLLGTFWGPMWLLFVLTPVATALYASWTRTFVTAAISSGALLGIYYSRGLEGSVGWGQASLHAAFIVFISLFVNSIARLVMQMGPAKMASKAIVDPMATPAKIPSARSPVATPMITNMSTKVRTNSKAKL